MRSRSQHDRRVLLALVLAVVLGSPALGGGRDAAPAPARPADERAEDATGEPLWQFETGG